MENPVRLTLTDGRVIWFVDDGRISVVRSTDDKATNISMPSGQYAVSEAVATVMGFLGYPIPPA